MDMSVQNAVDAVYNDLSKIPTTSSSQQLQSAQQQIQEAVTALYAIRPEE